MATRKAATVRLHNPVTPALLSRGVLEVASIEQGDMEYRFNPPLRLKRSRSEGYFVFENAGFSLYSYGKTERAALDAVGRDFMALWNCIAEEDDAKLESMARDLKRKLRKAVTGIWQKV